MIIEPRDKDLTAQVSRTLATIYLAGVCHGLAIALALVVTIVR